MGDEETVGLYNQVAKKAFIQFSDWDEWLELIRGNRNGDRSVCPFQGHYRQETVNEEVDL